MQRKTSQERNAIKKSDRRADRKVYDVVGYRAVSTAVSSTSTSRRQSVGSGSSTGEVKDAKKRSAGENKVLNTRGTCF